ncbi:L-rhamnose mutarotase [Streptomyces sp. NPDC059740]|uniref:L-rhamnose mutarotase n=1 Tax=Streptomyces sp. NPDC059740 TaxID=3346926 RepID=UPI0036546335
MSQVPEPTGASRPQPPATEGAARGRRHAKVVRLRPEHREEYLRLHAEVWPEVLATITACHIRNYSIFLHGDLLFSYYEYVGEDHEADMERMAADPATQRWWKLTDPCQEPVEGTPEGEWWMPVPEVFHHG